MKKGSIYLIPNFLAETPVQNVFPQLNRQIMESIDVFLVEDEKSARKLLARCNLKEHIENVEFHILDKKTSEDALMEYLQILLTGKDVGIISEAGCPGFADPGAAMVLLGHQAGIKVVPLVGPASILLALMASGLNGQGFTFHGYIPLQKSERIKKLRELEQFSQENGHAQIFIETPFRNDALTEDILGSCRNDTLLCIALGLTGEAEMVKTLSIAEWREQKPELKGAPAIFMIQAFKKNMVRKNHRSQHKSKRKH